MKYMCMHILEVLDIWKYWIYLLIKYKNKYTKSWEDGSVGKMSVAQAWIPKLGSSEQLQCLSW